EAQKVQIVAAGGGHIMIDDWLELSDSGHEPGIQLSAGADAEHPILHANGRAYEAAVLSDDQLRAFRQNDFTGLIWIGGIFLFIVVAGALLNYLQSNMM